MMATASEPNAGNEQPILALPNTTTLTMTKTLRTAKTPKKSWDADKALRSTYSRWFGKYQLRAYLLVALGYGIVAAWITEMPVFALLPPKNLNCTPIYPPGYNATLGPNQILPFANGTARPNSTSRRIKPVYSYSNEYGQSVLTEYNEVCQTSRVKIPHITYIIGLILGGLIFGYLADHSGRKMILLGSMWTACALSAFQLLSDDYISYVFFIFFLGVAIGAVLVVAIPYVMEMFPIESRAMYGLSLLGIVFLLDLVIPWLAMAVKNWKILQAIVTIPLIITAVLYWLTEESMFWYTAQKDFISAVLSLTKVAQFNGVRFEEVFREAREFLRGKHSKGIQCDFQPLLRLEDIGSLGSKYPDFDMVNLQATSGKKSGLIQRARSVITGTHYYPTMSTFYPTDYLHSSILTVYLLVLCGLWLVSSLTEYSLDVPHLTQHLTENFYANYFYTHLIQVLSFVIAMPLVYVWGRRWPTFCFFLIAEVCLLGSVAVKLDDEQNRAAMLVVYFAGKFATRAAFIVLIVYTCEIFPTGLRCTTLGICYTFRLIGIALASPDVAEVNDWMARLIYGILALVLGSLALLLPETKKFPLPRTILQVEVMPTSVSDTFRRRRTALNKRAARPGGALSDGQQGFSDIGSVLSGPRLARHYDHQSTMHSEYDLQDFSQYDTVQSAHNRNYARRMDSRGSSTYHPYNTVNSEIFRQQAIVEDVEASDIDDDRMPYTKPQQDSSEKKKPVIHGNDEDVIILPVATGGTSNSRQSGSEAVSQLEATAQIQAGAVNTDPIDIPGRDNASQQSDKLSQSPRYRRTMSQEENYFSEHC